jgi:hypothetical protein
MFPSLVNWYVHPPSSFLQINCLLEPSSLVLWSQSGEGVRGHFWMLASLHTQGLSST